MTQDISFYTIITMSKLLSGSLKDLEERAPWQQFMASNQQVCFIAAFVQAVLSTTIKNFPLELILSSYQDILLPFAKLSLVQHQSEPVLRLPQITKVAHK